MEKEFKEFVEKDIASIESVITSKSYTEQWDLFRILEGRYQTCIANFYEGMCESYPGQNFINLGRLKSNPEGVTENLKLIKSKLEVFVFDANAVKLPSLPSTQVNVTTNLHVEISFDQVRSQIEDMSSLTNEQTKEILEKISEIETVVNAKESKKSKWEKVKPVLKWLADKSFDVGIKILPLILKLNE